MSDADAIQSLPPLPSDLIEDILSRLTVKSLSKFKCVSKPWRSLIESEQFIKDQLRYSSKHAAAFFRNKIIFTKKDGPKQCSLHSLFNDSPVDSSPIEYPIDLQLEFPRIVGYCDGLFCILEQSGNFVVWNPATRISHKLPEVGRGIRRAFISSPGFGWDESSNAYKVFAVVFESTQTVARVYSSKTNSWTTVEHGGFPLPDHYREGQFAGGKLHWCDRKGKEGITYFDLKTEAFGIVEEPSYTEGSYNRWMGVLGQYLCIICDYAEPDCCLDVWVENYRWPGEPWEKVAVVFPHPDDDHKKKRPPSVPFGVGPNGEIMLMYGSSFLINYQNGDMHRPTLKLNALQEAYLYIESLVSPLPADSETV